MRTLNVLLLALLVGCSSTPERPPAAGELDRATIEDVKLILRNAARVGALLALDRDEDNVLYIKLGITIIDNFRASEERDPGAFSAALSPLLQDTDVEIQIFAATLADVFQVYWRRYIAPDVAARAPVALEFLQALADGAHDALVMTQKQRAEYLNR